MRQFRPTLSYTWVSHPFELTISCLTSHAETGSASQMSAVAHHAYRAMLEYFGNAGRVSFFDGFFSSSARIS